MSRELLNDGIRADFLTFLRMVFQSINPEEEFLHGKHIEAMLWHLEQCRRGNTRRLIISIAPRSLKSIITSVAFPLWVWTHNPSAKFLCASYGQELADANALLARQIMRERWFREAFPHVELSSEKSDVSHYKTTRQGLRKSTSTGGVGTGFGGDFVIIDDPHKATDARSPDRLASVNDWFTGTVLSRLNDPKKGCIIVVMQRLDEDDLAGVLLKHDGWKHICLPAIADEDQSIEIGPNEVWDRKEGNLLHPERLGEEELVTLRNDMGKRDFEAQYQQRPTAAYGSFLKFEWVQYHDITRFRKRDSDRIVQSWDTASKPSEFSCFNVCTTWLVRDNAFYLLDCFRDRLTFSDLLTAFKAQVIKWKPDVALVEDSSAGTQLVQYLNDQGGQFRPKIVPVFPNENKVERWYVQTHKFAEGLVLLPNEADWLSVYLEELLRFPDCPFSDQVDSTSQFLKWMEMPKWPPRFPTNEPLARRIVRRPGSFAPRTLRGPGGKPTFRFIKRRGH